MPIIQSQTLGEAPAVSLYPRLAVVYTGSAYKQVTYAEHVGLVLANLEASVIRGGNPPSLTWIKGRNPNSRAIGYLAVTTPVTAAYDGTSQQWKQWNGQPVPGFYVAPMHLVGAANHSSSSARRTSVNATVTIGDSSITVAASSALGSNNVAADFTSGMKIMLDLGTKCETFTVNGSPSGSSIPIAPNATQGHAVGELVRQIDVVNQTTLNGAINASVTSVVVNDASGFVTNQFVLCDTGNNTEVMQITGIVSNTLTVTRAALGSGTWSGGVYVGAGLAHNSGVTLRALCSTFAGTPYGTLLANVTADCPADGRTGSPPTAGLTYNQYIATFLAARMADGPWDGFILDTVYDSLFQSNLGSTSSKVGGPYLLSFNPSSSGTNVPSFGDADNDGVADGCDGAAWANAANGGDGWRAGVADLLAHIRTACGPNAVLVTNSNACVESQADGKMFESFNGLSTRNFNNQQVVHSHTSSVQFATGVQNAGSTNNAVSKDFYGVMAQAQVLGTIGAAATVVNPDLTDGFDSDNVTTIANTSSPIPGYLTGLRGAETNGGATARQWYETVAGTSRALQRLRFNLAACLMTDAYFALDMGGANHGTVTWFDEYIKGAGTSLAADLVSAAVGGTSTLTLADKGGSHTSNLFQVGDVIFLPNNIVVANARKQPPSQTFIQNSTSNYDTVLPSNDDQDLEQCLVTAIAPGGDQTKITVQRGYNGTGLISDTSTAPPHPRGTMVLTKAMLDQNVGWLGAAQGVADKIGRSGSQQMAGGLLLTDATGWSLSSPTAGAAATVSFDSGNPSPAVGSTGSYKVAVTRTAFDVPASVSPHTNSAFSVPEYTTGYYYTLEFWAKTDANDGFSVRAIVAQHVSPFAKHFQEFQVTKTWKRYSFAFPVPAPNDTTYYTNGTTPDSSPVAYDISLGCGRTAGNLWIGGVRVANVDEHLYLRRFANGAVILNATGAAVTLPLPAAGYKRINGTQSPYNNGAAVSGSLTIPAFDAAFLVSN